MSLMFHLGGQKEHKIPASLVELEFLQKLEKLQYWYICEFKRVLHFSFRQKILYDYTEFSGYGTSVSFAMNNLA